MSGERPAGIGFVLAGLQFVLRKIPWAGNCLRPIGRRQSGPVSGGRQTDNDDERADGWKSFRLLIASDSRNANACAAICKAMVVIWPAGLQPRKTTR
jgi:hypothetical protein